MRSDDDDQRDGDPPNEASDQTTHQRFVFDRRLPDGEQVSAREVDDRPIDDGQIDAGPIDDGPIVDGRDGSSVDAQRVDHADRATRSTDPDSAPPTAPRRGGLSAGVRAFFDWVVVVGVALLVAVLVRTFLLAHYQVEGLSMYSTLSEGDRVFVNKLSYRLHDPNRGDVVVLHELSGSTERDLIKRVIALPGETIEIVACEVYIDGFQLDEPYLDPEVVGRSDSWCEFAPTLVPDDHVFVMGDNRPGSSDSRVLGSIPEDNLVGRAFVVFWPKADWQWL